jgi:hypothetical protein
MELDELNNVPRTWGIYTALPAHLHDSGLVDIDKWHCVHAYSRDRSYTTHRIYVMKLSG